MNSMDASAERDRRVLAQFVNEQGEALGAPLDLPRSIDVKQLQLLCNKLLSNVSIYKRCSS